jgi:hypothetical protein
MLIRMLGRLVGLIAVITTPLTALAISSGIAASATPPHPRAATAITLQPPRPGTLWITNYNDNAVLSFAPAASGDTAPIATIAGPKTKLSNPAGVAIDSHGRVWVANHGSNAVTVYSPLANGDAEPLFTIAGAKTGLIKPLGLAITRSGNLWVASSNQLLEFGPGQHGNVGPIRSISGSATGILAAAGVAVTLSGKHIWVTNFLPASTGHPNLEEFSTTARGNVGPTKVISGPKTTLDYPYGIAIGISGDTPVTDNEDQPGDAFSLLRFAPTASGNSAPTHVITGVNTGLATPTLLAINALGAVWVPNFVSDVVERFQPSQYGNVKPDLMLAGPHTELDGPLGIADYITSPSVPRSVIATRPKTTLHLRWHSPAAHGGGIVGYRISRSPHRSGPWTLIATTTGTSYAQHHSPAGHHYRIQAYNNAGFSPWTTQVKPSG